MMDVQYYARQKSLLEEKVGSKSFKNAKKSYEQYDPHFLISVPLKSPLLTKMKDETGDETPHLISPTKYTKTRITTLLSQGLVLLVLTLPWAESGI